MASLDEQTPEWRQALRLVRAAACPFSITAARNAAILRAHTFLKNAASPRLQSLARLLLPDASEQAVIAALVPLERVDVRTRITDADLGLTDSDLPEPPSGAAQLPMIAVVDNVRSAFNVGGLFRTAEFFGLEALYLCGYTATPEHPQVVRSALGAEENIPWQHWDNIRDAIAHLCKQGRTIYALETSQQAEPLAQISFRQPAALLLGSERFGLDPDVVAAADTCVCIPGYGVKNSLNIVSAFAIAANHARS